MHSSPHPLFVFVTVTSKVPDGGCSAVLGLCFSLLVSWTEYRFSDTHFTALDVGQGQCMIVHREGRTFLIDCGGSNDEIAANAAADTLLSR